MERSNLIRLKTNVILIVHPDVESQHHVANATFILARIDFLAGLVTVAIVSFNVPCEQLQVPLLKPLWSRLDNELSGILDT